MRLSIDYVVNNADRLAIPIMTNPGIEIIGEKIRNAVKKGTVHYNAIKAISDTYASTACTVIMDLTVEAEAFGATVNFPEDEIPSVTGRLLSSASDVEQLKIPKLTAGRIPEFLLANQLAAKKIKEKPVLSGCIGPFSLAGRLYDMSEMMMAIYLEPTTVMTLLEKCTNFLINYCKALKKSGTDGVIIAEPAAGLLRNEDCIIYSTDYIKRIVAAVQDDDFIVVLHNCGNKGHCTDAMIKSGAKGLHFGNSIDIQRALNECPPQLIVMGNINPVDIFKMGSPEMIRKVTQELLELTKRHKNFIISSGCDLPPFIPEENLNCFFDTIKKFNSENQNNIK